MESVKNAVASVKETAANIGASAVAGKDKTKAVVEETAKKVTAKDPAEKEAADHRKEEKVKEAEYRKQAAMAQNASFKNPAAGDNTAENMSNTSTESTEPRSTVPTSVMPGHDTGEPAGGHVESGTVEPHPISRATGTGRPDNPHLGSEQGSVTGTGGAYT